MLCPCAVDFFHAGRGPPFSHPFTSLQIRDITTENATLTLKMPPLPRSSLMTSQALTILHIHTLNCRPNFFFLSVVRIF